ncbi:MAG TPA: hypothetical protein VIN09_10545 [Chloroflexota bacterium]
MCIAEHTVPYFGVVLGGRADHREREVASGSTTSLDVWWSLALGAAIW